MNNCVHSSGGLVPRETLRPAMAVNVCTVYNVTLLFNRQTMYGSGAA